MPQDLGGMKRANESHANVQNAILQWKQFTINTAYTFNVVTVDGIARGCIRTETSMEKGTNENTKTNTNGIQES
jgi:hypothetical protein